MVRKAKTASKQRQKQKQVQNVKQTVIVKLDGKGQRVKRRRRRRQPSGGGASTMYQSLPPNVIYQTGGESFNKPSAPAPAVEAAPAPLVAKPAAAPAVNMPVQFQDVGVGTEGLVEILDRPTKREQLNELITPVLNTKKDVSSDFNIPSAYVPAFVEPQIQETVGQKHKELATMFDTAKDYFKSQYEPITELQQQEKRVSSVKKMSQEIKDKRVSNVLEGLERKQMGVEDNSSIFLGGSEFNYVKPINELQKEKPFVNIIPPERQREAIEAQVQEMEKIQSKRPTVKYASKKPPKMVLTRAQKDEKNRKARMRRMIVKATKEGRS